MKFFKEASLPRALAGHKSMKWLLKKPNIPNRDISWAKNNGYIRGRISAHEEGTEAAIELSKKWKKNIVKNYPKSDRLREFKNSTLDARGSIQTGQLSKIEAKTDLAKRQFKRDIIDPGKGFRDWFGF